MSKPRTASAMHDLAQLYALGTLVGLTDRELLERFATRRDARAFEILLQRHGRQVWAECRSVLGSGPSSEDAFQATFLILVKKADAVVVADSLGPWLRGVSRRVAVRARRREKTAAIPDRDLLAGDAPVGDDLIAREVAALVREEVANLPRSYREPILACYFEGLTHEQAADRLQCPVGTVKGRLSRARGVLRDRLARRGLAMSSAGLAASLATESAFATVPARLIEPTMKAAAMISAGSAAGLAGTIPAGVLSLMNGVFTTMSGTKLTISAAVMAMAFATVAAGTLKGGIGPSNLPPAEQTEVRPTSLVVDDPEPQAPEEPKLSSKIDPRLWATAARIKIEYADDKPSPTLEMASGVIVQSDKSGTLILTTAHGFRTDGDGWKILQEFPHKIRVDVFQADVFDAQPELYKGDGPYESFEGHLVNYNAEYDLALVRIPTTLKIFAHVTASDPSVVVDQPLISIGCSLGEDPSAWDTRVIEPRARVIGRKPQYEGVICQFAPKQGRSGGGLFNLEGDLVGICSLGDPKAVAGLYTTARLIRKFLYGTDDGSPRTPERSPIVPDLSPDKPASTLKSGNSLDPGNIFPTSLEPILLNAQLPKKVVTGELYPVVYSLADLVVPRGAKNDHAEFQMLVNLLTSSVAPGTWKTDEADNDPAHIGSITTFPKEASLIIRHNGATHNLIVERLRQLRRLPALREGDDPQPASGKASDDRPAVSPLRNLGNDPYVIEPPDLLRIDTDGPEMTLKGEFLVRADGTITLGDLGNLQVAGLTVFEVKEKLVVHLRKHYSDEVLGLVAKGDPPTIHPIATPRVRVRVEASNSKDYYVLGDVAAPGRFPLTGSTTVLDALQYAGGIGPSDGKHLRLTLVRREGPWKRALPPMVVDLDAIMNRGDTKTNYELKPGDRLFVTTADPAQQDIHVSAKDPVPTEAQLTQSEIAARIEALQKELDALKQQVPR